MPEPVQSCLEICTYTQIIVVIMEEGDGCLHNAVEKHRLTRNHRDRQAEHAAKLFQERESALNSLRRAMNERRLCLFLGAGIFLAAGLPSWAELVTQLAETAIWQDLSDVGSDEILGSSSFLTSSLPILARFVKDTLPNDEFARRLREILYPKTKLVRTSPLIESIVNLIAGTRKLWVREIVTYNYDDVLEQALARRRIPFHVQSSEENTAGHLPELGNSDKVLISIVLSEDDYHRMVEDAGAWAIKIKAPCFQTSVVCSLGSPCKILISAAC